MIYPKQQAFILVTTLWMLAILTIAASFFAIWTQRAVELAQGLQTNLQGEIDAYNTQSQLFYLFATRRLTMAGLNPVVKPVQFQFTTVEDYEVDMSTILPVGGELKLDDTVYQGLGQARFSIQDKAGLFSLHKVSLGYTVNVKRQAIKLLGILGVPAEQRKTLIERLQDYVDPDDFHRLNGAEAQHYQRLGLPPPANRLLLNSMECRAILGWAEQQSLWHSDTPWEQLTTSATVGAFNLNTAPELVLQSLDGINAQMAQQIVAKREEFGVFINYSQFQKLVGVEVGGDKFTIGYRLFPSEYFRISIWHQTSHKMRQHHIKLTPVVDQASPWQIDYAIDLALPPSKRQAKPVLIENLFLQNHVNKKPP